MFYNKIKYIYNKILKMFSFCKTIKTYQYQKSSPSKLRRITKKQKSQTFNQICFLQHTTSPSSLTRPITTDKISGPSIPHNRNGISLSIKQAKSQRSNENCKSPMPNHQLKNPQSIISQQRIMISILPILPIQRNYYNPEQLKIIQSNITRQSESIAHQSNQSPLINNIQINNKKIDKFMMQKQNICFTSNNTVILPQLINNQHLGLIRCKNTYFSDQIVQKRESIINDQYLESVYDSVSEKQSILGFSSKSEIKTIKQGNKIVDNYSKTCSWDLNDESQQILAQYANEVERSIIIKNKPIFGQLSTHSLLQNMKNENQSQSNNSMISYSPVKRMKSKYKGNLLNIYNKQTFISHSNKEQSYYQDQTKYIIDQSIILRDQTKDYFQKISNTLNKDNYQIFLAKEKITNMIVSIKRVSLPESKGINQYLYVNQIANQNSKIHLLPFYHYFQCKNYYEIIRSPYQTNFKDFIIKNRKSEINWPQFIDKSLQRVRQSLEELSKFKCVCIQMIRTDDLVLLCGQCYIEKTEVFTFGFGLDISQIIKNLNNQIELLLYYY